MKEILVCRDNKNKCRVVTVESVWDDTLNCYFICRESGLLDGKKVVAPKVPVIPKAKRNNEEQLELMFKSAVKGYLDKGYKTIKSLGHETLTTFKPDVDLPETNTNQDGIVKPMLCKVYDPNDKKSQNINWLASRKLDGLRCFIYMKDGELHTSSRGGSNYDVAASYILTDAFIKQLLTDNPGMILDGELYHHGWNLQKISGLGRLETLHEDHKRLQFYCYDFVDENKTFNERVEFLRSLNVAWNSLLVLVEHVEVTNNQEIDNLHDKWVSEGYEGLVLRDPNQVYKSGGRDRRMQKVKKFTDGEFKVIGYTEGLRPEDFVFRCLTIDNKEFEAKPIGTREEKDWYLSHMEELIGQMATVKYFNLTPDGIPNLPVLMAFVNKKDK